MNALFQELITEWLPRHCQSGQSKPAVGCLAKTGSALLRQHWSRSNRKKEKDTFQELAQRLVVQAFVSN